MNILLQMLLRMLVILGVKVCLKIVPLLNPFMDSSSLC